MVDRLHWRSLGNFSGGAERGAGREEDRGEKMQARRCLSYPSRSFLQRRGPSHPGPQGPHVLRQFEVAAAGLPLCVLWQGLVGGKAGAGLPHSRGVPLRRLGQLSARGVRSESTGESFAPPVRCAGAALPVSLEGFSWPVARALLRCGGCGRGGITGIVRGFRRRTAVAAALEGGAQNV